MAVLVLKVGTMSRDLLWLWIVSEFHIRKFFIVCKGAPEKIAMIALPW